jgi:hypothetical protein
MQTSVIVWRSILLLSLLIFPQMLGFLLYLRLTRFPRWIAHVLGVFAATFAFLYLSPILFFAGLREAQLRGELTCGMPAFGATILVLVGTGIQLLIASTVHLIAVAFARRYNQTGG